MKTLVPSATFWPLLLVLGLVIGCSSKEPTPPAADSAEAPADTTSHDAAAPEEPAAEKPSQLGDLLEPFAPPPLEELEKSVEWIDRPVLDGMELMREHQNNLGPPPLTVEQSLGLRNESRE